MRAYRTERGTILGRVPESAEPWSLELARGVFGPVRRPFCRQRMPTEIPVQPWGSEVAGDVGELS